MSVGADASFGDVWCEFAPVVAAALAGLRRQRHGGRRCDPNRCEECGNDVLGAIEMIYLDQQRFRRTRTANLQTVIRNRYRDTVLRPATAARGFSHRPERLVRRRSVQAAITDSAEESLLGQLIEHLAHGGRTAPLTDANGRWCIDTALIDSLLAGLARRGRLPDASMALSSDDLAQRLLRVLVRLATTDSLLADALDAAAARSATSLPAATAPAIAAGATAWPRSNESSAFQAALPQLADQLGPPLAGRLRTDQFSRLDVLGTVRALVANRRLDRHLVAILETDDEAARDVVAVIADQLIDRQRAIKARLSWESDDQAPT